MDRVESIVAQIVALSNDPKDLNRLSNVLKQADDFLHANAALLLPFLQQLDPSEHSLGYLYFLGALTTTVMSRDQASELVAIIGRFLNSCIPEQILLNFEKFIFVCQKFKDQVLLLEAPMRGVAPMLAAIRKLQPNSEHLTVLHPDYLLLCLLSKCYRAGLHILADNIYETAQPRAFFLYCYYGSMICTGQKKFRKALELLHNVVTAPMSTINAIAVEAYKKYILISLIHYGQFSTTLPKYTSSAAQRNLKSFCQDRNLGLVNQVLSSIYKRNIQRLTQTYLTLSLQDIANSVQLNSPKEAETHVLQMIQDGEIYATINQKDGMVSFLEDQEQYKSCEMIEHIDSSIQRLVTLSKKLTAMDKYISCDPLYLSKFGRERHRFDFDDFDPIPRRFNLNEKMAAPDKELTFLV